MARGKSLERSKTLTIRLTPEELEAIKNGALCAGLTVTAFLVSLAAGDKLGQMMIDGFGKSKQGQ